MTSVKTRSNHLEFYQEHKITPVRYNISDMDRHLERRYFLYTRLGIPPIAFRNVRVLEVAAGTGHNSLYVSSMMPSKLVLLEPNQSGINHIHEAYKQFNKLHKTPEIIMSTLENFMPNDYFDIVLCENWLGTSSHELSLLRKLGQFVAPNGMLVVTNVSPIGLVPNILRRFFSAYIAPLSLSFEQRTDLLSQAFVKHLQSIGSMTRNTVDWVQDNMINPAYFSLCLTPAQVAKELGDTFDIISSSPTISEDWRWFKEMTGEKSALNEHFLAQYWQKAHNFLDYRAKITIGDSDINIRLEEKAVALLKAVEYHEDAHIHHSDTVKAAGHVVTCLAEFIAALPTDSNVLHALREAEHFLKAPELITAESIANMKLFSTLFGRETSYLSLNKRFSA